MVAHRYRRMRLCGGNIPSSKESFTAAQRYGKQAMVPPAADKPIELSRRRCCDAIGVKASHRQWWVISWPSESLRHEQLHAPFCASVTPNIAQSIQASTAAWHPDTSGWRTRHTALPHKWFVQYKLARASLRLRSWWSPIGWCFGSGYRAPRPQHRCHPQRLPPARAQARQILRPPAP